MPARPYPHGSTAMRSATALQCQFIETLSAERVTDALSPVFRAQIVQAAEGRLSVRAASQLIHALDACPRTDRSLVTTYFEAVATPSASTRAGRMLLAGGIEATATFPNGEHVTVRIVSKRRSGRGWANCGPTDNDARTTITVLRRRVGWVGVHNGEWAVSFSRNASPDVKAAIHAIFDYAAGWQATSPYRVQEASRCGRCMRTLTDPVSIDRGVGPECYGRTTGSHHAAVEAPSDDSSALRVEMTANTAAAGRALAEAEREVRTLDPRRSSPTIDGLPSDSELAERQREYVADRQLATYQALTNAGEQMRAVGTAAASASAALHAMPRPTVPTRITRARDLIAEALDAQCEDDDRDFAMRVFDRLVEQTQTTTDQEPTT